MKIAAPAQFLNLDVVLKSDSDLREFIDYLDERVFVLSHQEFERQFILVLELAEKGPAQDIATRTRRFLAIIDEFPDAIMNIWKACASRTFSYGFESGTSHPALEATIDAELVYQIGRVGADIGITVYPIQQSKGLR